MFVAGEEQHLPPLGGCPIDEQGRGGLGALGIKIDEHVVEDQRHRSSLARQPIGQRQPQAEEELFACAAAQQLDGERLAVPLDSQRPLLHRRPHAAVAAAGHAGEIRRSVAENFRLAIAFVIVLYRVQQVLGRGDGSPARGRFLQTLFDDAKFERFLCEAAIGFQRRSLVNETAALLEECPGLVAGRLAARSGAFHDRCRATSRSPSRSVAACAAVQTPARTC